MATDYTDRLTRIVGGQEELKGGQAQIADTLAAHGRSLRLISEHLGIIIEKLTPELSDGPTMQELLAELVVRVGDNGALLRRIDRRTENMAKDHPDDGVPTMKGAPGANGKPSSFAIDAADVDELRELSERQLRDEDAARTGRS